MKDSARAVRLDRKHTLFWRNPDETLWISRVPRVGFILSVHPRRGKPQWTRFTRDELSSLVCEVLKYCLDMPEVARLVPCRVDASKKPHGIVLKARGGKLVLDERWLRYHGNPKSVEITRGPGGALVIRAGRPGRGRTLPL